MRWAKLPQPRLEVNDLIVGDAWRMGELFTVGLTSQDQEEFTQSGLLRYKRSASCQRKCL